jgi:hypothetical protein
LKPGDVLTVWNAGGLICHQCHGDGSRFECYRRPFLLCPQNGLLLLFIQEAQLSSFRTMGFGGFSFSADLSAMIWPVILSM